MSFFYDLNKKLDGIRATPEVTHQQLNERDMSRAAKGYEKYGKQGMEALAKAGREGKALDPIRKKYDKYDNKEVDEGVMDTVKSVGKKVASGINRLVGHGSDEDMRKDLQRKSGAPVTGKKPEQKTTEAAKYRDPKYKDKLYTQEPPDYTYGPDMDDAYDNPKPDDYAGRKRKIGGGEFPSTDPLERGLGIGRSGIKNNILDRGPRKGLPSRDQISSLKGSIKSARGTHAEPNLPEAAGSIDYEKVLEAIAALYGDDMWDNDAMGDLAQDLEQAGPTDRELDFIIAKGKLPTRLKGIRFTNTDDVQFGHLDEKSSAPMTAKQKSFAALAPPANKITFADKIAGAKKEVDEMLGDVAAEAMRSALGGGKGRNAGMDEERSKGTAFDMSTPRAAAPKVGSIERGHKHDIKHTATGRMVTRRVDDQGNSVGADDDSEASGEKRGRGRPKGTKQSIGAKGPSGRSKLMTKEGVDQGQAQQIVDDLAELRAIAKQSQRGGEFPQGFASQLEVVLYAAMTLIKNQQSGDAQVREEELDEKAVSKKQQKFMGMVHAAQKGEKPASKEVGKVAKTMKKKDAEDFASTKHKGLPEKAPKKKKEEEVDESTTSGSVATSTATTGGKGGVYGKGIYDSMNRELETMISESMNINMSDSTEGNKSLTITATDDDAMKLAMILKSAGIGGGDAYGSDMHSHGEEACDTCGMPDCGCGDVQEAVDENAPDWPTNTEQADNNFGYAGGLNKPKTDVAGDGQTTVPNTAVHTQDEDALRRMMEMAGLTEGNMPMVKKDGKMVPAFAADGKGENDLETKDKEEDTVDESIQRMREMAGIREAKKTVDEEKTEEGNLFTKGLEDDDVKIGDKIPGTNAIKKKDIDESIFALTNQWKAYKG